MLPYLRSDHEPTATPCIAPTGLRQIQAPESPIEDPYRAGMYADGPFIQDAVLHLHAGNTALGLFPPSQQVDQNALRAVGSYPPDEGCTWPIPPATLPCSAPSPSSFSSTSSTSPTASCTPWSSPASSSSFTLLSSPATSEFTHSWPPSSLSDASASTTPSPYVQKTSNLMTLQVPPSPMTTPSGHPKSTPRHRTGSTRPRNKQVEGIWKIEDLQHETELKCNECQHTSKRQIDLTRHMKTHRATEPFVCLGVPVGEARRGVDRSVGVMYGGWWYVGGCAKSFSRKDSCQRHIKNSRCTPSEPIPMNIMTANRLWDEWQANFAAANAKFRDIRRRGYGRR